MAKKIPQYITIQKCNNMYHGKSPQNKNYCERKKVLVYYIKLLLIIMDNNAMVEYLWVLIMPNVL